MTTFRASARFELKRLDELPPEQRNPFEELTRDADFYGLLVPQSRPAATIKAAGREIAELFRALAVPAPLEVNDDVIDLVLDGVLEVECDGRFVCGADALPILCDDAPQPAGGLSADALRHATDLEETDADTLTRALYFYNRIPITPFWKARFPDAAAVIAHLGAANAEAKVSNGWIVFQARARRAYQPGAATYKLYVSPRPENIRDAFDAVVRTLAGRDIDFKIGLDAAGLLRPDKMVAYFGDRAELDDVAAALRARLAGCPAHGVPFTAAFDDDGLLSWGLDPPESARALSWLGRESWRLWLASKLGTAMALAKSESVGAPAPGRAPEGGRAHTWRFAVERVRRLGVDVDTWTPRDTLWSDA